jgi:hypothetical protein
MGDFGRAVNIEADVVHTQAITLLHRTTGIIQMMDVICLLFHLDM